MNNSCCRLPEVMCLCACIVANASKQPALYLLYFVTRGLFFPTAFKFKGRGKEKPSNNEELVNLLVDTDVIRSTLVEQAFRAVDRGNYFLPGSKNLAYTVNAWKEDKIHLSSPTIYGQVVEALRLGPAMSFLNLGSGTGYLSTIVGLILGLWSVLLYSRPTIVFFSRTLHLWSRFRTFFILQALMASTRV